MLAHQAGHGCAAEIHKCHGPGQQHSLTPHFARAYSGPALLAVETDGVTPGVVIETPEADVVAVTRVNLARVTQTNDEFHLTSLTSSTTGADGMPMPAVLSIAVLPCPRGSLVAARFAGIRANCDWGSCGLHCIVSHADSAVSRFVRSRSVFQRGFCLRCSDSTILHLLLSCSSLVLTGDSHNYRLVPGSPMSWPAAAPALQFPPVAVTSRKHSVGALPHSSCGLQARLGLPVDSC